MWLFSVALSVIRRLADTHPLGGALPFAVRTFLMTQLHHTTAQLAVAQMYNPAAHNSVKKSLFFCLE
jgi:hypothetical protein